LALAAGPVPSRVDAHVKAGLLELVDHAVDEGWSARRAAELLGPDIPPSADQLPSNHNQGIDDHDQPLAGYFIARLAH
jgi:hypothetical protein